MTHTTDRKAMVMVVACLLKHANSCIGYPELSFFLLSSFCYANSAVCLIVA